VVLGLFEPTDAGEHAARIQRRLAREGVTAELLPVDDAARVIERTRAGVLPLLVFESGDRTDHAVEERFARLASLLAGLSTRKLIFLSRRGGITDAGTLVPLVNLTTEFELRSSSKELSRKERAILVQSRRLVIEGVPHKLLVAITSPFNLFRELFTAKGAGTMLRRGATLTRRVSLDELERARLGGLLESAFGRPPVEEFFGRQVSQVYLEEAYRGVAILVDTPLGAYLSKFAVEREAQGEGIGRDLWAALAAEHATVFWRARPENPINPWYAQLCDGLSRLPGWNVYWKGLASEKIPDAIAFALAQPIDIPSPGD
jgi:acetylglutamate kinase